MYSKGCLCFEVPVRWYSINLLAQGEMINESGTMSGGGGKPKGGRMCLGKAALCSMDTQTATAELRVAEQELESSAQVGTAS